MGGKAKSGHSKGRAANLAKQKSLAAWGKKKVEKTKLNDVPAEVGVRILGFLTRKQGQNVHVEKAVRVDLNSVCKLWFYWLECHRHTPAAGLTVYDVLARMVHKKMPRSSRSQPVSPCVDPSPDTLKPRVLVLSELAVQPPESPLTTEASTDIEDAPRACSEADAKALVAKYVSTGGCKTQLATILTSLFKYHRTALSEKCQIVKASLQHRKKESAKANELIRWSYKEYGLDPNTADSAKRTIVHYACLYRDTGMTRFFLQQLPGPQVVDLSLQDRRGQAPLHYCAANGCVELAQLLLGFGTHLGNKQVLSLKDSLQNTPLAVASKFNHNLCSQVLSKRLKQLRTEEDRRAHLNHDEDDDADEGFDRAGSSSSSGSPDEGSPPDAPAQLPPADTPTCQFKGSFGPAGAEANAAKSPPKTFPKKAKKVPQFDGAEEHALNYADRRW